MLILIFIFTALFSAVGTMAGFGGGIFAVPFMVMAFGIPIEIAIGVTALSLFPSSLLSTYWNVGRKTIDFRLMVALEIPTLVGAVGGAKLTSLIPARPLEVVFAVFLLLLGGSVLLPPARDGWFGALMEKLNRKPPSFKGPEYSVSLWAAGFFGGLSGVIAGFFGIGGGVLKTPIMINVFQVPLRTATSTALCMIVFTSLTSGTTHFVLGHVQVDLFLACAGGFVTGAIAGHLVGLKLVEQTLKRVIAGSIMLAGVAVLIHTVWRIYSTPPA